MARNLSCRRPRERLLRRKPAISRGPLRRPLSRYFAMGACEFRGSPPGGDAAKLGENSAGSPHLQSELPVVAPGLLLESRRPRRVDEETHRNGQLPGTHMRPLRGSLSGWKIVLAFCAGAQTLMKQESRAADEAAAGKGGRQWVTQARRTRIRGSTNRPTDTHKRRRRSTNSHRREFCSSGSRNPLSILTGNGVWRSPGSG